MAHVTDRRVCLHAASASQVLLVPAATLVEWGTAPGNSSPGEATTSCNRMLLVTAP